MFFNLARFVIHSNLAVRYPSMGLQVVLFSEPFTQGTLQMYFNLARSRQCPLGFLLWYQQLVQLLQLAPGC